MAPAAMGRRLETLKHRRDFLQAARAATCARPGLVLQARRRQQADATATPENGGAPIRYGLTATRKIGGAVERNRARRRLRAAAETVLPDEGRSDTDYVLVARRATLERPWNDLLDDLRSAMTATADGRPARGRTGRRRRGDRERARP